MELQKLLQQFDIVVIYVVWMDVCLILFVVQFVLFINLFSAISIEALDVFV